MKDYSEATNCSKHYFSAASCCSGYTKIDESTLVQSDNKTWHQISKKIVFQDFCFQFCLTFHHIQYHKQNERCRYIRFQTNVCSIAVFYTLTSRTNQVDVTTHDGTNDCTTRFSIKSTFFPSFSAL